MFRKALPTSENLQSEILQNLPFFYSLLNLLNSIQIPLKNKKKIDWQWPERPRVERSSSSPGKSGARRSDWKCAHVPIHSKLESAVQMVGGYGN